MGGLGGGLGGLSSGGLGGGIGSYGQLGGGGGMSSKNVGNLGSAGSYNN